MTAELTSPDRPTMVAIEPRDSEELLRDMSEWTDRIARRAYDLFTIRGFADGHDIDDWLAAERDLLRSVSVEISELKNELFVRAEVPGFEADDLTIEVNGNRLVIKGEKEVKKEDKDKDGNTIYTELTAQHIYKMVELPMSVLAEKAKAVIANGTLEVTLPRTEEAGKIMVKAA